MTALRDFVSIRTVTPRVRTSVALMIALMALPVASAGAQTAGDRSPASGAGPAANSVRFTDPAADVSAGGMDMTNLTVSNDDAGKITFRLEIPTHQSLPVDKEIVFFFDTDRNSGTGSPSGNEFAIWVEGRERLTALYRWDAAQQLYLRVSSVPVTGTYAGGAQTVELNRSGLGGTTSFDFAVCAGLEDSPTCDDWAPSTGRWTYEVKLVTRRVAITGLRFTPSRPAAGQTFTVTASVRRVGWSGQYYGDAECFARIGGRTAEFLSGVIRSGEVVCNWKIPANAIGKMMVGSVVVSEEGTPEVTRKFRSRVVAPKVTLSTGGASLSPRTPEAGRRFYYALTIFVSTGPDTERRIRTGTVTCQATIGGRAVPRFEARVLRAEGVRCGWDVPGGTAGRQLRGTIVVRSEGATLRHTFTRSVR